MSKPYEQIPLLDAGKSWEEHWVGMPTYHQDDLTPYKTVKVHFRNDADMLAFGELLGQKIVPNGATPSIWFPQLEIRRYGNKRWSNADPISPRYPIYIISKGRWESRLTVKALDRIGVAYRIVVEPQEYDQYASVIDPKNILALPFSNLGLGSIPARNWVWDHAISEGHKRHWILDDNISGFNRLCNNLQVPVASGSIFCAAEDFTDRYENIALSGFNYDFFAKAKDDIPPYVLNTRIYSCILIDNALPMRWRGRYNEDTDLSIRVLKSGLCTVLFNAFLALKATTMTMEGGNTDELYQNDGRERMAESLREQHPDIVKITRKWGRVQHSVNYRVFRKNRPIMKADIEYRPAEYGMVLREG